MVYQIRFTKEAKKDVAQLTQKQKEKLLGDLSVFYSICLSYKNRILYTIDESQKLIYIHRAKTHYGD